MIEYTLKLSEEQARVVAEACEVICRLGMGQLDTAFEHLPGSPSVHRAFEMERMLSDETGLGGGSYYGIRNEKVAQRAKVARDLYRVIEHRMAWDRAIDSGLTTAGVRKQPEMMGCHYDKVDPVSNSPLASFERCPSKAAAPPLSDEGTKQ